MREAGLPGEKLLAAQSTACFRWGTGQWSGVGGDAGQKAQLRKYSLTDTEPIPSYPII